MPSGQPSGSPMTIETSGAASLEGQSIARLIKRIAEHRQFAST